MRASWPPSIPVSFILPPPPSSFWLPSSPPRLAPSLSFIGPSTLSPSASSSYRASAALAPLLATPPSVSAGFGLAYTLGAIRLEVNYNLPLVAGRGEGRARGLGVAMGIDYL